MRPIDKVYATFVVGVIGVALILAVFDFSEPPPDFEPPAPTERTILILGDRLTGEYHTFMFIDDQQYKMPKIKSGNIKDQHRANPGTM